jgi:hypothetical protein
LSQPFPCASFFSFSFSPSPLLPLFLIPSSTCAHTTLLAHWA